MNYVDKYIYKNPVILLMLALNVMICFCFIFFSSLKTENISTYSYMMFKFIVPTMVIIAQSNSFRLYSNINVLSRVDSLKRSYISSVVLDVKIALLFMCLNIVTIVVAVSLKGGTIAIDELGELVSMFIWLFYFVFIKHLFHLVTGKLTTAQIGAVFCSALYYFFNREYAILSNNIIAIVIPLVVISTTIIYILNLKRKDLERIYYA